MANKVPYFGRLLTAMVTPFTADGVNYDAALALGEHLIAHGTDALVVCGSTGEAATMTEAERLELFRRMVAKIDHRVPIIAGTGTNCTATTIESSKKAVEAGVDGILVVGPMYNKPTQEGYYQHFAAVAKAVDCPIIVYNVPGRTGGNILPATVARLAKEFKNIVAVKEAAGSVAQVAELYRLCPPDFTIYSGDDGLVLPFMSVGATGVVSVLANVDGEILQAEMQAFERGDNKVAMDINKKMVPLANAMFIETNPIPVKAATTLATGIDCGDPRLPLTSATEATMAKLREILAANGLLKA